MSFQIWVSEVLNHWEVAVTRGSCKELHPLIQGWGRAHWKQWHKFSHLETHLQAGHESWWTDMYGDNLVMCTGQTASATNKSLRACAHSAFLSFPHCEGQMRNFIIYGPGRHWITNIQVSSLYIYPLVQFISMEYNCESLGNIIILILPVRKMKQKRFMACPKSPGNGIAKTESRIFHWLGSPLLSHYRGRWEESSIQLHTR